MFVIAEAWATDTVGVGRVFGPYDDAKVAQVALQALEAAIGFEEGDDFLDDDRQHTVYAVCQVEDDDALAVYIAEQIEESSQHGTSTREAN
jgi:hypothetical protein